MKHRSIVKKAIAVAVCGAITATAVPAQANSLAAFATVPNTDFAWAGYGGMRGIGNGTITVAGVTGTVTYAVLIWHGPTNNAADDAANAAVTFNGTPVTGTNIGNSDNNCWGYTNSRAYQANVTSLVTGNGAYALTNFRKTTPSAAETNGASLLVFYNDGNATNNRDYAIFLGNDSNITNSYDPAGWSATLNGITYTSGTGTMRMIVSDGQTFPDIGVAINATTIIPTGNNFDGNTVPNGTGGPVTAGGNGLWDHSATDITSLLTVGTNNLALTSTPGGTDCLSLIGAIFDLPGGSAPPGPPPPVGPPVTAEPVMVPTLSEWGVMLLALLTGGVAALNLRRRRK
jgi:hypothetical protein